MLTDILFHQICKTMGVHDYFYMKFNHCMDKHDLDFHSHIQSEICVDMPLINHLHINNVFNDTKKRKAAVAVILHFLHSVCS